MADSPPRSGGAPGDATPASSTSTGTGTTAAPNAASLSDATAPPLLRRMACWLYEGVLMFGVVVPAGLVYSVAVQQRHALAHRDGMIAFLFVVLAAYFTWFWSKGQTLAMRTWNVAIVDRQGRRLTWGRALVRYVFSYIWFLPPLAAFGTRQVSVGALLALLLGWVALWAMLSRLHPQRQFWHDALAGTRLVHRLPTPRAGKRP